MKKIYFLFLMVLLPLMASAVVERTINVATAGSLPNLISDADKHCIQKLTLTGELNGTDIKFIREMAGDSVVVNWSIGDFVYYYTTNGQLTSLDISNVSIVEGGGAYFYSREYEPQYNESETYGYYTEHNSISKYMFGGFHSKLLLKEIILPNSVSSIGNRAFFCCNSLYSITIPNGVSSIGDGAFYDCSGLTSVSIPNSVTYIGSSAFCECRSLTSVTIPSSVMTIKGGAFCCRALEAIYLEATEPIELVENPFDCGEITYNVNTTNCVLYVPKGCLDKYRSANYWKDFVNIIEIGGTKYTLTYKVDGKVYKTYELSEGDAITPEPAPTKEGYTFSGWSDIPTTMPAKDVTITGSFSINKYNLIYKVDGAEYKKYEIEYGAAITPETAPVKEGYTFSGWSDIPATMPAKDVTVIGSFTINKYKLIYKVDGVEYKNYDVEYGATITPEPVPTKEGYTFSGWSEIPTTMPAKDVTITGSFTINKYKLIYMVDGAEYKKYEIEYGATITPESEPTKDGYTFSGWSEIPKTMPAKDVTVTGTFSKGAYKLTYMVDGVVYKTVSYDYGDAITPESAPVKEGYTFSGWSDIPATMPAKDITVTGSFTINKYKLIYMVDGAEYKKYDVEYGAAITPEAAPTKEGYTFSGWSEIPKTMPARDVTVTGSFIKNDDPQPDPEPDPDPEQDITQDNVVYEIEGDYVVVIQADNASGDIKIETSVVINGNTYTVTIIGNGAFKGCTAIISVEIPNTITTIGEKAFDGCTGLRTIIIGNGVNEIGRKAFANIYNSNTRTRGDEDGLHFYCDAEVVPATSAEAFVGTDIENATLHVPDNMVETYNLVAPWNGFGNIVGLSDTGIRTIGIDKSDIHIYDLQGNRLNNLQKGVNIIRTKDGKTKKYVLK